MPTASGFRLLLACWLALAGAGVLAGLLLKSHRAPDLEATRHVVGWRVADADAAFRVLSTIGSPLCVASACALVVVVLAARRALLEAALLVLAYPGTVLLVNLVKTIVGRPRPPVEALTKVSTSGFPSGHAAGSLALIGALLIVIAPRGLRARRLLLLGGIVLALAIGASRVYLGVHYPSDVLAGWLLSGTWLLILRRRLGFGARAEIRTRPWRRRF
jgi:undecaprenyl-diphosphatase